MRDKLKSCIQSSSELICIPAALPFAILQQFKIHCLDAYSTSTRDEVNRVRSGIDLNSYVPPTTEQRRMSTPKNILSESMVKLTTSVQWSAQHCTDAKQALKLLAAVIDFHEDFSSTIRHTAQAGMRRACLDLNASLNSFQSELQALEEIETVHQAEMQNLIPTVSDIITRT